MRPPLIPPPGQVPDADLLARFARDRDEAAFELLVWRHRRMVLGVGRRVAGNAHDAEDAAQAAFLVLARRADRIGANLAGWLYRVAYRCAVRARKASRERERPEVDTRRTPVAHAPGSPADAELLAALDDELNRLPEKYRTPVVLCYLQGLTYREAADRLGCPVGTLSGWLTRAKDMLRDRLTRRGVALSAGSLAAALDGLSAGAAESHRVAIEITRAATAFAAGETPAGRAAAVALGVVRAMTLKSFVPAAGAGLLAAVVLVGAAAWGGMADEPPKPKTAGVNPVARQAEKPKTDAELLQGVWVFDAAGMPGDGSALPWVWDSRVTVKGDTATITKFYIPYTNDVIVPETRATIRLDPATTPRQIDLQADAFTRLLSRFAFPFIPPSTTRPAVGPHPGIYQLNGDTLTVCLANQPGAARPTEFKTGETQSLIILKRSRHPGNEVPATARVTVRDPDGTPVAGAIVTHLYGTGVADTEPKPYQGAITAADGTATVPLERWAAGNLFALHPARKLAEFLTVTPADLVNKESFAVTLRPACRVTGTLANADLARQPAGIGWTSVVLSRGAYEFARYASTRGRFEFLAPPGTYALTADGTYLARTTKTITIEPGQAERRLDPIAVPANDFGKLLGKPAPELKGVKGWKGEPVKLADLKGKPVLLMFWVGYDAHLDAYAADWLADLHEVYKEYKDRGLEVILVAVDRDGRIDTPEEFATKGKAVAKKATRKPEALTFPFRVAMQFHDPKYGGRNGLVVGNETMADYGVSYPMFHVLIDREGNVVGQVFPTASREQKALFDKVVGGK